MAKRPDSVDVVGAGGLTPFARACRGQNIREMRRLLEANADPRQVFMWRNKYELNQYPRNRNQIKKTTAALAACALGNVEMLRLLLEFGVTANDGLNGRTLLVAAACARNGRARDMVALLLEHAPDLDAIDASSGMAALHVVCREDSEDNLNVLRQLLEAGASVDLKNEDGQTVLYHLCIGIANFYPMIELVLQHGADVHVEGSNWRGGGTMTPLVAALEAYGGSDFLRVLTLLIEHIRSETNFDFRLALESAARRGHADAMRLLLEHAGADANAANANGVTPLHLACEQGHHEVAKVLLEAGADANANAAYASGVTPLHLACEGGHQEVVETLLNAGANISAVCNAGRGALAWALGPFARRSQASVLTAELLLSRGADVNQSDLDGRTPLHWSLDLDFADFAYVRKMVGLLLQSGADPNVADAEGRTPISMVCRREEANDWHNSSTADLVYMLVQGGAEVDTTTSEDGLTPFLMAATQNDRDFTMGVLFRHQKDVLPDYSSEDE